LKNIFKHDYPLHSKISSNGYDKWISWITVLFIIGFAFLQIWAMHIDSVPVCYDPLHLSNASRLLAWAAFGKEGALKEFRHNLAVSAYPPLIHIVSFPFELVSEGSTFGLKIAMAAWGCLALLGTFLLTRKIAGPFAGLVAMVIISGMSGFTAFDRIYMPDAPLGAITAIALWLVLKTDNFHRLKMSMIAGLICGLGCLVKQSFPFAIIGPVILFFGLGVFRSDQNKRSRVSIHFILFSIITIAVPLCYYIPRLSFFIADRTAVNEFYKSTELLKYQPTLYMKYLLKMAGPVAIMLALIGALSNIKNRNSIFLLCSILIPLFTLDLVFVMDSERYVIPLLPAIAALASLTVPLASRNLSRVGLVLALLICAFFGGKLIWSVVPDPRPFTYQDFHNRLQTEGMTKPRRINWNVNELYRRLISLGPTGQIIVLGDHPFTEAIQSAAYDADPRSPLENLFEGAGFGRPPKGLDTLQSIEKHLALANIILVDSGLGTDPDAAAYTGNVSQSYANLVFQAFIHVKDRFNLIESVPIPETSRSLLIYKKNLQGDL